LPTEEGKDAFLKQKEGDEMSIVVVLIAKE
jgi:hypothetical protein